MAVTLISEKKLRYGIIVYCQATYFSSRRWYGIPGWVCRGPQDVTTEAILSPQLDILLCLTITRGWVTPPSTILQFKVKDNDIQIILWHLIFLVFQYVLCWRDNYIKKKFYNLDNNPSLTWRIYMQVVLCMQHLNNLP